ncbi:conserved hypothetical protein [Ricinus communis]|uniref:PB1-like domain-containing protein n=1 Tax=Ricinus communis TaxID=3988 RepID=B9REK9_RICCO|nr:conserved hypothetical protein [Ricinus communis]
MVRIHNGGKFVRDHTLWYSNGEVEVFLVSDIDLLHYQRVVDMLEVIKKLVWEVKKKLRRLGNLKCIM